MTASDELSLIFGALASPLRRDILDRLGTRTITAGELAAPYAISTAAVSQNLTVLERAGLVTRVSRGQWRDVSLRDSALDEAARWVDRHRGDWNRRLDQLEQRAKQLGAREAGR